jgi:hypothetical protein
MSAIEEKIVRYVITTRFVARNEAFHIKPRATSNR